MSESSNPDPPGPQEAASGPGWWRASDGRWYPPVQGPGNRWKDSDGNWYRASERPARPGGPAPDGGWNLPEPPLGTELRQQFRVFLTLALVLAFAGVLPAQSGDSLSETAYVFALAFGCAVAGLILAERLRRAMKPQPEEQRGSYPVVGLLVLALLAVVLLVSLVDALDCMWRGYILDPVAVAGGMRSPRSPEPPWRSRRRALSDGCSGRSWPLACASSVACRRRARARGAVAPVLPLRCGRSCGLSCGFGPVLGFVSPAAK